MVRWLLLLVLVLPAPLLADDEDERPDGRPEIATLLEALAERVTSSGRDDPRDEEAVELIDTLAGQFGRSGDRDRAAIVRGLDRVFLARRRAKRDGERETSLFEAAAKGLGRMGDDGAGKLVRWVGHPRHKRDVALQRELILALGKTGSDKVLDDLEGLLDEDVPELLSAAATALGNYSDRDQKVRKALFESILKTMESARENARGNDSTALALWAALRGPGQDTLRRLSGERQNDPVAWRSWWNDNKRRDWDE